MLAIREANASCSCIAYLTLTAKDLATVHVIVKKVISKVGVVRGFRSYGPCCDGDRRARIFAIETAADGDGNVDCLPSRTR